MEFRVLGPLEVIVESGPVNLGGPQQRRLLAVLLADQGRVLTYDRLVDVLWPDGGEPPNARRSTISYISRLRASIGENAVETTDAGYLFGAPSATIDADRFLALLDQAAAATPGRATEIFDEALALWRGPVFGDLNDEWWARPFALKLDERRLTALADRIDALAADGWDGRALAEATSLVAAHPLREQFVERAMRGMHVSGQTADALRIFQQYRSNLADQTGLDPSDALAALERSMVVGDAVEPSRAGLARPLRGYVLRELLGEGSFGAVYRATQPGVGRDVAVKAVRAEFADDREFIRRFEAEAQMVARLEHPHIVPLYDFWRQPGGAFLVFRMMRGGTGEQAVAREGRLSLDRVNDIVEQVGDALGAAHRAGVVHRDVKPANILFDDNGASYLADFGIAATLVRAPSAAMNAERWSTGSALYASPEQLRDGVEDAQADQYALAATAWELLTGRPPFDDIDAHALVEHKVRAPLGGGLERPLEIPESLAAVLARAGAVHPSERFADVAAFVDAWRRAFSSAGATATDPPALDADTATGPVDARRAASTRSGRVAAFANPYKGLRPFREADATDFHGRRELVDRLTAETAASSFVAVVGPSGSGKSSLVLAGLVPRLRCEGRVVAAFTPGNDPFMSLADALERLGREDQVPLLDAAALRADGGVHTALTSIGESGRVALVIDQFEELWTLTDDSDRARFAVAIALAVDAGQVMVVVTIRADFFDRPLSDPSLGPLVSQHTFGVTPLTASEAHDAITAPVEAIGVRFEPALVSRLVAETIDQPGSLPLLQFTLAELFEQRVGATITADSYDSMGGLAGSLSRQSDALYDSFDQTDQAAVRRLFARLVVPGDGAEDTRRRAAATELSTVPDHVVQAFVDRRLLTTDRDQLTREPTTEVAHEILLRSWPRLRAWLDEDRSWLRGLRGLSSAAMLWDAGGRDTADLYRGARLAVVNEGATSREAGLTELESTFLAESVDATKAEERNAQRQLDDKVRQNRRLRRTLVGLAAVLAVAIGAGGIAAVQRSRANSQQRLAEARRGEADQQRIEADRQRSLAVAGQSAAVESAGTADKAKVASELTTLASRSLSLRSSQRDLAALLAVEAWQRSPDATSKSALFGTFTFDPGFLGYLATPDTTNFLDGVPVPGTTTMLLSGFPDSGEMYGPIRQIDVLTGAVVRSLPSAIDTPTDWRNSTVSSDGKVAAVWEEAKDQKTSGIGVFDLASGTIVNKFTIPNTLTYNGLALDTTGGRLAVTSDLTGDTTVYDTRTALPLVSIPGLADLPPNLEDNDPDGGTAVYGPDGRLYVGSLGEHLRVFDPTTFSQVADIAVPSIATGGILRFADATTLVARGIYYDPTIQDQRGSILRLDVATGKVVWQVSGDDFRNGPCASFAFSAATNRLWCGNYFGVIRERSLASGAPTGRTLQNERGWVGSLHLIDTPRGSVLAGLGNNFGLVARWQVGGGSAIRRVIADGQTVVGELPNGKLLVGSPTGKPIPFDLRYSLWDAATDTAVSGLPDMPYATTTGKVVFGLFADGSAGTYDPATKEQRSFPANFATLPTFATATFDGAYTAAGFSDGHVAVTETATGKTTTLTLTGQSHQPAVGEVAITDDHSRVYVTGRGLYSFDLASGRELAHNYDGQASLAGVAVAPNGMLAVSSVDGTLGLYDPDTLQKVASLPGARGFIQRLTFSQDSKLLIGAANDQTVSFYDVAGRVRLGDPIEVRQPLATHLRSDGLELALTTASELGTTGSALVDLDPAHWVTAACKIAGRNLTTEEWTTYIGDLGTYHATCPT